MIPVTTTRLQIRDLSVLFPGVRAVDRVSLDVQPGEFFSLLGPSGCGKTTLLRTIAGFYRQNEGSILFNDRSIDRMPAHKRDTGMVFQHYAIFPHLDVWQNVAYGLRTRPGSKEEKAERVRAALELVDLEGLEHRKPRQLSGGQQQRVAVARAIVIQPSVLLMDEPLANLDAKLRVRLRTDLRTLQQRLGITTIYVTHDQEEALSLSDRIAVMFDGKVHQVGTPQEIYARPTHRKVAEFVGEGNYLDGEVRDVAKGRISVGLPGGGTLRVAAEHDGSVTVGTPVVAGFRLHHAAVVAPGATADNTVAGTVRHRVYLGDTVRYHVELSGGGTVMAEHYAAPDEHVRTGDAMTLRVPPEAISLFGTNGTLIGRTP
jgi:iron(III) transport system ATP-binding protein